MVALVKGLVSTLTALALPPACCVVLGLRIVRTTPGALGTASTLVGRLDVLFRHSLLERTLYLIVLESRCLVKLANVYLKRVPRLDLWNLRSTSLVLSLDCILQPVSVFTCSDALSLMCESLPANPSWRLWLVSSSLSRRTFQPDTYHR